MAAGQPLFTSQLRASLPRWKPVAKFLCPDTGVVGADADSALEI